MTTLLPEYRSYVLRIWQTSTRHAPRASLLNVQDPADQHHFVTVDELCFFLNNALMMPEDLPKNSGIPRNIAAKE